MRKIIFALFVAIVIAACSSIDCPVQNLVYTQCALKKSTGKPDTLLIDSLFIWTKRIDGTDTLLINGLCDKSSSIFALHISYTQPEDVFFTQLRDTAGNQWTDTFRIKKIDRPHFESVDCQAAYFHELQAIATTHHIIDSITIQHPYVDYDATNTHLYFYFKPRR